MKNLEEAIKVSTASIFHMGLLTHTAHFNVIGPRFYELHLLLERIYKDIESSFDDFGEQIRALDIMAPINLREYMALSILDDDTIIGNANELIHGLLINNDKVIDLLTQTNALATNHLGLQNFLQGRIMEHEKHGWMLRATIQGK